MNTFAKLKAPVFGRGQLKVVWERSFDRMEPEDQVSVLDQAMKALMAARKQAAANARIKLAKEDARNAEAIRPAEAATS